MAILTEVIDKTFLITINRPEAMNSIDPETVKELDEAFDRFRDDDDLWVCVLTGAGERAFCAGADLKKHITSQTAASDADRRAQYFKPHAQFGAICRNYSTFKPIIAAVNGACMGGGFEIALACDVRFASENAKFALPEPKWGILPGAGGIQRLIRAVPRSFAMEMLLDARTVGAEEALRWGLVSRVYPQEKLLEETLKYAASICEKAPLAVRAVKECVLYGENVSLTDALQYETGLRDFLMRTEDAKEGPKAFAEKRKANFRGQ